MADVMWDRTNWDREGQEIAFLYKRSVPCSGKITSSRVMYGGDVQHTVLLDMPTEIRGYVRNVVCVQEGDLVTQEAV